MFSDYLSNVTLKTSVSGAPICQTNSIDLIFVNRNLKQQNGRTCTTTNDYTDDKAAGKATPQMYK